MKLAILDYSPYGNPHDLRSDEELAHAARKLGWECEVLMISRGKAVDPPVENIWLRYDLRSPEDLSWVVDIAQSLRERECRLFPTSDAIEASEDKWLTFQALRRNAVPTPETVLADQVKQVGFPAIIKPRVGWGGKGIVAIREADDLVAAGSWLCDDYIAQPYIAHDRTWIVACTSQAEIVVIEEVPNDPEANRRRCATPPPSGTTRQAIAAIDAVGLAVGTVDVVASPGGMSVLEVNSAPRIAYPHLPDANLAGPMVDAVLTWMTCA